MSNRIIYSDGTTLLDLSPELARYKSGTAVIDSFQTTHALYIGQRSPFNHFFVKMGDVANTNPTQMVVHYWDGTVWVPAVDTQDVTSGLSQDGFVEFYPNKNKGWTRETTNFDGDVVTGLEDIVIYDLFWARITFTAILDNDIELRFIGQKFSDDDDLASEYPDLVRSTVLTRFEAGKTSWEEQHVRAAEIIEQDLIQKRVIKDKGQILERDAYRLASVHKVAEMIFGAFGDDYADQKLAARHEYKDRMDKVIYLVDESEDGILDPYETKKQQGWLSR
jgi:hypothetical protein